VNGDRRVRVVIADDHAATRQDTRRWLERNDGIAVCAEAGDAPAAVDAVLRERPEIALLDIHMPGGGIAAVREIAARLPDTKIVMYTVSTDDGDLLAALRAGASGYLLKTTDPRRLGAALLDVADGRAAIPRALVPRLLQELRAPATARRRLLTDDARSTLTSREWEVLELLVGGVSGTQIASRLVIGRGTVRWHVHSILKKLELPDREALIRAFRES
jgi:DNA-binding NarL/FixJ family response regulator